MDMALYKSFYYYYYYYYHYHYYYYYCKWFEPRSHIVISVDCDRAGECSPEKDWLR